MPTQHRDGQVCYTDMIKIGVWDSHVRPMKTKDRMYHLLYLIKSNKSVIRKDEAFLTKNPEAPLKKEIEQPFLNEYQKGWITQPLKRI